MDHYQRMIAELQKIPLHQWHCHTCAVNAGYIVPPNIRYFYGRECFVCKNPNNPSCDVSMLSKKDT